MPYSILGRLAFVLAVVTLAYLNPEGYPANQVWFLGFCSWVVFLALVERGPPNDPGFGCFVGVLCVFWPLLCVVEFVDCVGRLKTWMRSNPTPKRGGS